MCGDGEARRRLRKRSDSRRDPQRCGHLAANARTSPRARHDIAGIFLHVLQCLEHAEVHGRFQAKNSSLQSNGERVAWRHPLLGGRNWRDKNQRVSLATWYYIRMPRISEGARLERRQQLIDAAWRCAERMGYSELTVDDICAEAEVSKGAFYGYFSSKQDLLIALLEEDAADLDGRFERLAQRNMSNVERLRSFAREMCERGTDQARVQVRSDLWAAILTEPAIRDRMVSGGRPPQSDVAGLDRGGCCRRRDR